MSVLSTDVSTVSTVSMSVLSTDVNTVSTVQYLRSLLSTDVSTVQYLIFGLSLSRANLKRHAQI